MIEWKNESIDKTLCETRLPVYDFQWMCLTLSTHNHKLSARYQNHQLVILMISIEYMCVSVYVCASEKGRDRDRDWTKKKPNWCCQLDFQIDSQSITLIN